MGLVSVARGGGGLYLQARFGADSVGIGKGEAVVESGSVGAATESGRKTTPGGAGPRRAKLGQLARLRARGAGREMGRAGR